MRLRSNLGCEGGDGNETGSRGSQSYQKNCSRGGPRTRPGRGRDEASGSCGYKWRCSVTFFKAAFTYRLLLRLLDLVAEHSSKETTRKHTGERRKVRLFDAHTNMLISLRLDVGLPPHYIATEATWRDGVTGVIRSEGKGRGNKDAGCLNWQLSVFPMGARGRGLGEYE